jgi:hypothetical protein
LHITTAGTKAAIQSPLRSAGIEATTAHLDIYMSQLVNKSAVDGIDPVTKYRTIDLFRKLSPNRGDQLGQKTNA